jgi:hypothetical protein
MALVQQAEMQELLGLMEIQELQVMLAIKVRLVQTALVQMLER